LHFAERESTIQTHNMGLIQEVKKTKAFWDLGLSLAGTHAADEFFRPVFKALDIEHKLEDLSKQTDKKIVAEFVKTLEKLEK